MMGLVQRLRTARAFSADRFVPFEAGERERVGWIRRDRVAVLGRWPEVFAIDGQGVRLRPGLEADRTAALEKVARALAKEGAISGWRNETYAVRARAQDAPLFHIERAAMRFFGFTSEAAHLNGYLHGPDGLRMWIARRSNTKAIDPGLLDTLVGGGIASGQDPWGALVRECHEEAGIEPALAKHAKFTGVLEVCHEEPAGLHQEILHAHDLGLTAGFQPRSVDGEVAEFLCLRAAEVADRIANGEFTVDAGILTLDFLLRSGAIEADAESRAALDRCRLRP